MSDHKSMRTRSIRVAVAIMAVTVAALVPSVAAAKYGPGGGLKRSAPATHTVAGEPLGLRGPLGAVGDRPRVTSQTRVDWTALIVGLGIAAGLGAAAAISAVRARPRVGRPAHV